MTPKSNHSDEMSAHNKQVDKQSEVRIPVYMEGKKVGELPLATEYRILLEGLLLSTEADLQYYRKELKRLDKLVELLTEGSNAVNSTAESHNGATQASSSPSENKL